MLFRKDPIDVIRKGNLNKLRKMLEKKPELLDMGHSEAWFKWPDGRGKGYSSSGNILHMAAFFNQPEIIKFLVNEKSMNINQPNRFSRRTPLHYACQYGGFESASLLFSQLGADSTLRCSAGTGCELSEDERIKALLLPSYEAQMQQEEAERQERDAERLVQERAEAEKRIVGTWEINPSTSEIVHEHELPGGEFHVTDAFNFATGRFTSIFKELGSGNVSPKDHFFKPEEVSGNPALSEAFSKLQELTGNLPAAKLRLRTVNKGP